MMPTIQDFSLVNSFVEKNKTEFDFKDSSLEVVWKLYPQAIKTIEKIIEQGKKNLSKQYSHTSFFRSNKPKKYFEDLDLAETLEVDEPVSY